MMDFNQTARETLTRVQSELAQGQTQISWDILYPIFDRENYLKEMKKSFGWRSHIKSKRRVGNSLPTRFDTRHVILFFQVA